MARLVQKFGGSTLSDVDALRKAAEIAIKAAEEGNEVTTVVSALAGTSQQLLNLAERVHANPGARELDMLLVTGEQVSVALLSMAIQAYGWPARAFTGQQAGIITENRHGSATIKEINCEDVEHSLARGEIAVVAGFQGCADNNEITTLGEGGVDTTAIALACSLDAERCDVYCLEEGVCTADPIVVKNARVLPALSYEEMLELSAAGSRLMSAAAVELAMDNQVPIRIRSVNNYENLGTLITHRLVAPDNTVCSVVLDLNQSALTLKTHTAEGEQGNIEGISSLFTRLDELAIPTDMIMLLTREDEPSQELAFATDRKHVKRIRSIVESLSENLGRPKLNIDSDVARISIIGRYLTSHPEVVAGVFETLSQSSIPVHMVSTGDLRVSVVLPVQHASRAVKLIHNRFRLSEGNFTAVD